MIFEHESRDSTRTFTSDAVTSAWVTQARVKTIGEWPSSWPNIVVHGTPYIMSFLKHYFFHAFNGHGTNENKHWSVISLLSPRMADTNLHCAVTWTHCDVNFGGCTCTRNLAHSWHQLVNMIRECRIPITHFSNRPLHGDQSCNQSYECISSQICIPWLIC